MMYDKKILSHSSGFLNNIKDKSMYKLILSLFKSFLPESRMDVSLLIFFSFYLFKCPSDKVVNEDK